MLDWIDNSVYFLFTISQENNSQIKITFCYSKDKKRQQNKKIKNTFLWKNN